MALPTNEGLEFKPLSQVLIDLGKTTCLFCKMPATQAANYKVSEIRCCDSEVCKEKAAWLAVTPF